MKKWSVLFTSLSLLAVLAACGGTASEGEGSSSNSASDKALSDAAGSSETAANETPYAEIVDDTGRTVVLDKKPEKVLPLLPNLLDLFYASGGSPIGKPTIPPHITLQHLPEEANSLPDVGHLGGNVEAIVALQPDLVIGGQPHHDSLVDTLSQSGIPVILLNLDNYEDSLAKADIFAKITGQQEIVSNKVADMQKRIEAVQAKMPSDKTKIAIVHINPRDVALELEDSIAGSTAKLLGLENVAAGSSPLKGRPDKTPYSIEKLVEDNPDKILLTTMGGEDVVQSRIRQDIENNPAWSSLDAVKQGEIYFLPQDLFLVHPGLHFADAVEYMASTLYPENFADGNQ
ncbi:ABC transporter substrate-binding protein [Paenibacillus lemnae]|uniref:ABC transporter substrate-binding protein n=1 Tax=Paenibacillus lemnae TaxID=1330551 RepID=A0A848MBT3_PAELE|nr:ABC transporter substrate-binding protein [Paenibacillus lemnae]NMO97610.1 ABC transporter substrate-binding protein [Paenibacillus lemnae]